MKLTLRKCDGMSDWYIIERHEEPGEHREWYETTEYGARFMHSARLSDADVEGTALEMLDLADAIEARGEETWKRCAVRVEGDRARFWSPRNTNDDAAGWVPLADADALAVELRARLAPGASS